jgi:hypothetical protein
MLDLACHFFDVCSHLQLQLMWWLMWRCLGIVLYVGTIFGWEESFHTRFDRPLDKGDLLLDCVATDTSHDCVNACNSILATVFHLLEELTIICGLHARLVIQTARLDLNAIALEGSNFFNLLRDRLRRGKDRDAPKAGFGADDCGGDVLPNNPSRSNDKYVLRHG